MTYFTLIVYRVFKYQVDFLKVVQLGAPWTNLSKFFFSGFLKMVNFCQVTKQKDFYIVPAASAGAEKWNRNVAFFTKKKLHFLH